MKKLELSLAVGDYDINRGLIDGVVSPQGIDLIPMRFKSPPRHWRMLLHQEFDVCEMSMGAYTALTSQGDDSFVGIPVFPHRRFRHGYVFVSGSSDVSRASDLQGKRIGVRNWETTAGVFMRGFLADHHDLPLDSVEWVAQDQNDIAMNLPPGLTLTRVEEGQTVTELCASGDLAGLLYPDIPAEVTDGSGTIRRLFEDPRAEEERYFRDTGIFPIMHLVVIRREIVERHPWVCRNLMEAFTASKKLAIDRLRDPRTVSLAWLTWLIERERELLGPDPWNYGIEPNRHILEVFLRYAQEQGIAERRLDVEELFHESVRDNPPEYV